MVVQNQTSEQSVKLRLDGYDTILLDAHGVFLTDYQNLRKTPGFNYGGVNCWTKMKCCSNWCLEILDTLILCTCSLKRKNRLATCTLKAWRNVHSASGDF